MRLLMKNHFEAAYQALRAHRARTLVTLVGITIGIAGITFVLSLAAGTATLLQSHFPAGQDRTALIQSGIPSAPASLQPQHTAASYSLTQQDAAAIATIPHTTSAPLSITRTALRAGTTELTPAQSTIIATTPAIREIMNLSLREGQFIDEAQGVVVGHQLAIDLFGTEHALGLVLHIRDQPLTVIGVLRPIAQPQNYLGINFNHAAFMPMSTAQRVLQQPPQIQSIIMQSHEREQLQPAIDATAALLKKAHHGDQDFHILTGHDITAANAAFATSSMVVMGSISLVSLLIGGISVMNSMLVNVAERQREVGIRKAIGATNGNIISQFLIESAIIGLIGGILGYLIGIGGAFAASAFLPLAPTIQWQPAAVGIGIAVMIGIIAGLYPAVRAANQNTIISMRT